MSKKPKTPKPARITCEACGAEYDAGAPHSQFCPGCPPDAECENCGEKGNGDETLVAKCRECDAIFCSDCGVPDERVCASCADNMQDGE